MRLQRLRRVLRIEGFILFIVSSLLIAFIKYTKRRARLCAGIRPSAAVRLTVPCPVVSMILREMNFDRVGG